MEAVRRRRELSARTGKRSATGAQRKQRALSGGRTECEIERSEEREGIKTFTGEEGRGVARNITTAERRQSKALEH
ncbi:hypothetical protein NDU88_002085 [Pleurodeles waltl]|uniref:Uncharacterized protein n=1 Tax=Pleurodeles waltl TaxID=8319 RepID=A0AAV7RAY4_PLEWA|nr:hypothetical protein NDU88_002085 [Pleurodeles waltl]